MDKRLIGNIDIGVNSGHYVSFASSLARMLGEEIDSSFGEHPISYWDSPEQRLSDWEKACEAIKGAMIHYNARRNGKHYGKHYAIYGQLLMYKPDLIDELPENFNKTFNKANQIFTTAIQSENIEEEDYYERYTEFCHYQNKCEPLRLNFWTRVKTKQMQTKIEAMSSLEETLKQEIDNQKAQEIELLSVFTAIISIILIGGQIVLNFSLIEAELIIVLMIAACVSFICILNFLMLEKPRRIHSLILCIIATVLVIALIVISWVIQGRVP